MLGINFASKHDAIPEDATGKVRTIKETSGSPVLMSIMCTLYVAVDLQSINGQILSAIALE